MKKNTQNREPEFWMSFSGSNSNGNSSSLTFIMSDRFTYILSRLLKKNVFCYAQTIFRNPALALSRLLESPWKRHQSKDMLFLHRNCKQYFFSTPKKILFFRCQKNKVEKIEKFSKNVENFQENIFHQKFPSRV